MKNESKPSAESVAEEIVFRWYSIAQEEHDALSAFGLASLQEAIEDILLEKGWASA